MYRFLSLCVIFLTLNLEAKERPNPLSAEYGISSSPSYEDVNLLSKAYTPTNVDIEVKGPEPISLIRYYNHQNKEDEFGFGCCVSLNLAYQCKYPDLKAKGIKEAKVQLPGGSWISYFAEEGSSRYYPDPDFIDHLGNTPDSPLSQSIKSSYLVITPASSTKNKGLTLYLKSGCTRYYDSNGNLKYEVLPSGNKMHYKYVGINGKFFLAKVFATDPQEEVTLGSISITWGNGGYSVSVKGSNGQQVDYFFQKIELEGKTYKYLTSFKQSFFDSRKINYQESHLLGSGLNVEVLEHKLNGQSLQKIGYTHEKLDKKTFIDRAYVDYIYQPTGANGDWQVKYRLGGTVGSQVCAFKRDNINLAVQYNFQAHTKRTQVISEGFAHPYTGTIYPGDTTRSHLFVWNQQAKDSRGKKPTSTNGNLSARTLRDAGYCSRAALAYEYDVEGFVTKEKLIGNLSGLYPNAYLSLEDNNTKIVPQEKAETFSRSYTYSTLGQRKLISSVEEEGGLNIQFTYVPNSNRIASKLTRCNGKIVQREFYQYNSFFSLLEKIVDDGSSPSIDDFADVTERHVEQIDLIEDPSDPGFGQPRKIAQYYFDTQAYILILLKKEEIAYNDHHLVSEKSIYDAKDTLLYTLYFEYDDRGNLIKETTPAGMTKCFGYDVFDRCISEEVADLGLSTTHTYDKASRKIKTEVKFSDGQVLTTRFHYDEANRLIKEEGPYGQVKEFEFFAGNKGEKYIYPECTDENGNKIRPEEQFFFNVYNQIGEVIGLDGKKTLKEYNSRGQITRVVLPEENQNAEQFEYYLNGNLKKKIGKNGTYVCYTYDPFKRPLSEITYSADGQKIKELKNTYKGNHLVETIDSMGLRTVFTYDGAGRRVCETVIGKNGEERVTEYEWDACSRLHMTKKWTSDTTWIASYTNYDILNREVETYSLDHEGNLLEKKLFSYDLMSNKTEEITYLSDDTVAVTRTFYNVHSEPIRQVDPYGNETHIHWNHYAVHKGQQVLEKTTIDPIGNKTVETMDTRGLVVMTKRYSAFDKPLAYEERFYDVNSRERKRIYHIYKGNQEQRLYTIDWEYDTLGNITKVTEQKAGKFAKSTYSTYDSCGRLEKVKDARGITLTRTYDSLNRLKTIQASDNSIHTVYHYDLKDRLIRFEDKAQGVITSRTYDDFGAMTEEKLGNGLNLACTYYPDNNLRKVTLPDQSSIEYDFDGVRLLGVKRKDAQDNLLYEHTTLEQDWFHRELKGKLPNGQIVERTFDLLGRPLSIASPIFSQRMGDSQQVGQSSSQSSNQPSGYDAVGNLIGYEQEDPVGKVNNGFDYDDLYQLHQEKGSIEHVYEHDSLHNRIAKDQQDYVLNELNQITSDGAIQYRYDANGNLSERTEAGKKMVFAYDALNRLVSAETHEKRTTYLYDSLSRRLSRTAYSKAGNSWQLEGKERFIYQGSKELGAVDNEGKLVQLRVLGSGIKGELGAAVAIELSGKVYVPYHDHRGNVTALWSMDENKVAESYRYSAFGEILYFDSNQQEIEGSLIQNPWLFASKRLDLETGLIFFGQRYYDSNLGRWITPDPLGFAEGGNLYAYVHGKPLTACDPHGLFAFTLSLSFLFGDGGVTFSKIAASIFGMAVGYMKDKGNKMFFTPGPCWSKGKGDRSYELYRPNQLAGISHSGRTGGKVSSSFYVRFVTGQENKNKDAIKGAYFISLRLNSYDVAWTCHNTLNSGFDTIISIQKLTFQTKIKDLADHYHYTNGDDPQIRTPQFWQKKNIEGKMTPICHLSNEILKDYNRLAGQSENVRLHIIAHSRGAIETYLAAMLLPPEVRKTMHIYTIGAAFLIPHEGFGSAINYVNRTDEVPKLAQTYYKPSKQCNIIYTPKELHRKSSWNILEDHPVECRGYQWALDQITDRIRDLEKI